MKFWKLASVATLILASTSASAALIERLGGLAYYDDVADLTWLADANAAGTTMNWADANSWAAGLTVDGVDGWRLADADPALSPYNQTDSEMGNLFYNVLEGSLSNTSPFSNVQSYYYWTATEYAPRTDNAWLFNMLNGVQTDLDKTYYLHAWAVQSGDVGVAVSTVPVPAAVWLFGSGLIGLAGMARRKKA